MAELSESDRMRIVREQVAAVETGIAEGRYPESQRTALMRDAATFIKQEPTVTSGEAALFEASRARMASDLRGAADVMASATDPYPVTVPESEVPREDGRYDLGRAPAPAPASSSAVAARVEVSGANMSFEGLPVVVAADGTTRVVTSVGDVTVATLRSLNLDMDAERLLYASRARMGNA